MALPALALTWQLVSAKAAIKYKASVRMESIVRTPLLTENSPTRVVSDLMFAPRLESVLYTSRLEVKLTGEAQLFARQLTGKGTFESLESIYTRADYKLLNNLTLLGVHTTTYGNFPLESFAGAGVGNLPIDTSARALGTSAYIYTETAVGLITTLGIKRLNVAGTIGWIVNGLLDPPVRPLKRGDAAYPQQRYPELRVQSFYGATSRDYFTTTLYGRDVSFSTGNRDSLLQFAPGVQHAFSPLVSVSVEPGIAAGRIWPRSPEDTPTNVLMPTLETSLKVPVPLGNHWPVQATLRAKYVPYMDPLTTLLIPRAEGGVDIEWKGRRDARVLGKLRWAHPLTAGIHRNDVEARSEVEMLLPLPLSRYLFVQAKGQFMWTQHVVLAPEPIVQWFTSVGLVVRYDRGRL